MAKRIRKNRRKKQRNIIIISVVCLTFIMVTAYSAFSTSLTLTTKGNIKGFTVTFDANGGNVDIRSKRIKYALIMEVYQPQHVKAILLKVGMEKISIISVKKLTIIPIYQWK